MESPQQARWLEPRQQTAWRQIVGLMITLPAQLDARLQRDAGLSHFEYGVLAGLSDAPDRRLRMSALAGLTNGSLSRLSHVVKRLEQRGWVTRVACPGDARATNAVLTPAGHAKLVEVAPGHVDSVRELVVDRLTDAELQQLATLSAKILADGPGCADPVA